jgi:hypothetical protein
VPKFTSKNGESWPSAGNALLGGTTGLNPPPKTKMGAGTLINRIGDRLKKGQELNRQEAKDAEKIRFGPKILKRHISIFNPIEYNMDLKYLIR